MDVRRISWILLISLPLVLGAAAAENPPANDGAVTEGWHQTITEEIAASEYHFSASDDGRFQAPNRAHDLRTFIDEHGIEVVSRTGGPERFLLQLTLEDAGPGILAGDDDRLEIRRPGGITEWLINDERGLEHGFDLAAPLTTDGTLSLALTLTGNLTASLDHPRGLRLESPDGETVLRYDGLLVKDAVDRELPARFELDPGTIRIVVDDSEAIYPVTVDPLLSSVHWTRESNQTDAFMGFAVGTAGDVDGDGYSDVIVGAYAYDAGSTDEGRAWVYPGKDGGLSTTAMWTGESNQASSWYAFDVAALGDVNNDGYDDIAVGIPKYDAGSTDEGRVYVYYGSKTGPSTTVSRSWESNQTGARFGYSVKTAGDVNGDGYADAIVGAYLYDTSVTDGGQIWVYHGSASGLPTTAAFTGGSQHAGARFGFSVSTAGDVNGDGYDEVIVGAYAYDFPEVDEGRVFVYRGSSSGITTSGWWNAHPDQAGAFFGWKVGTAGDVNGDGYADVIIGSPYWDGGSTDEGRIWIYHGTSSGLSTTPEITIEPNQTQARMGWAVATAGDVNGDGYADVIAGSPLYDNGQGNEGRAWVYHGSGNGLDATVDWTAESNQVSAEFGRAVYTAGDVNGDGYSDVIIGAPLYDNPTDDEGRAYVYLGSSDGLGDKPINREKNRSTAQLGFSVAPAGDVNGDGYSDIVVGAPYYDNGQTDEGAAWVYHGTATGISSSDTWGREMNEAGALFGYSVDGAGDVNGDGYDDIIVGAYLDDDIQPDWGRAYVFYGGSGGVAFNPAWENTENFILGHYGKIVRGAGDVNGDGYADVLVGSPEHNNGGQEGRAFVYHGSPSGPSGQPDWEMFLNFGLLGYFASAADCAGDVNNDGYSDVIVGAYAYAVGEDANAGAAFIYHGSANGLPSSASTAIYGDQQSGFLGRSVAGAGDVDGDGFSDVALGADGYDNPNTVVGRIYVHYGSPSGIAGTPSILQAPQTLSGFGEAVAYAGDVDGDDYSDIVVGARLYDNGQTNEGRALIYRGSGSGINTSPAWTRETNQTSAYFGQSVAGAGDVNGDGFDDVLVGAPRYDNGSTDEGRIYVYYGGGRAGTDLRLRQAEVDGSAPLAQLGMSQTTNGFAIRARARSAAGRDRVRLYYQVRRFDQNFNGGGQGSSSELMTGAPNSAGSYVDIHDSYTLLAVDTPYKWRARIESNNPLFPRTPWFDLAGNGILEWDFRTECGSQTWYRDADGDGYGNPSNTIVACDQPAGYIPTAGDCNDGNGSINPGQAETTCDGIDNDCSAATLDAPDVDSDGVDICDVGDPGNSDGTGIDCNPVDGTAWEIPGEARKLTLIHTDGPGGTTTLDWIAPLDLGGTTVRYDTSRSADPADFGATAVCLEDDGTDTQTLDSEAPLENKPHFFLVAATNSCGAGTAGQDSSAVERPFAACP